MGNYDREYLKIAMPSAAEGVCMVLLSSADLIMIGTLGTEPVAAVSIFVQPKMILLCIARSLSTAIIVLTAQKIGMKRISEAEDVLRQCLIGVCLLLIVIHLVFFFFLEQILRLSGAEVSYMSDAVIYARTALCTVFINSISIVLQAFLMGTGKTGIVMKLNVSGSVINIVMNGILIWGLGPFPALGIKGAALGSLSGAVITLIFTVSILRKKGILSKKGKWLPEKEFLSAFFKVFWGVFLEQGSERIGMVLYSRMAAGLGTVPFVVHSISMNVCDIYYNFAQGMGKASMVLAGRSAGVQKAWREYAKSGIKISIVFSIFSFLFCFLSRDFILSLYTEDSAVREMGNIIMIFVAVVSFPEAHAMICAGVLRGSNKTGQVALYSFISITIIRPLVTAILIFGMDLGIYGAWISLLLDQIIRALCSTVLLDITRRICYNKKYEAGNV